MNNQIIHIVAFFVSIFILIFPGLCQRLFAKYSNSLGLDYYSVIRSERSGRLIFRLSGLVGALIFLYLILV